MNRRISRFRLAILAACALFVGCKIVVVSGPLAVSIGETVEYVLGISSISVFGPQFPIVVRADVPEGWMLESSTFEGTVGGAPVASNALVVQSTVCNVILGDVRPGYRRWSFQSPTLPGDPASTDTAEVTLRFTAVSQPAGELTLYFVMGNNNECSTAEVLAINRPPGRGFLTLLETFVDDRAGIDGLSRPRDVALAPDGQSVYVAGEGLDRSIAVFSRQPVGGRLVFLGAESDGVGTAGPLGPPVALEVSPDGTHLYVASRDDSVQPSGIGSFSRDPVTGELAFLDSVQVEVDDLVVSPDGQHVYASNRSDAAPQIAVYTRNQASGFLSFVESLTPGGELAISPDGRHVYALDSDIRVYGRDAASGALTPLDTLSLERGVNSTFSPDGRHLYSVTGDSIVVHGRDETTGLLNVIQILDDLTGESLNRIFTSSVAVSPGGRHVVVGSSVALTVLRRDPATGELAFVENLFTGNVATGGWDLFRALAFSPGGQHLYGVSQRDTSLAVFETPILFFDDFESGTAAAWSATSP